MEIQNYRLSKQQGVALFIALVMLLVLTMIGVSAVQTSSLEERMARNARDRMIAFQAAESALTDAERFLRTTTTFDLDNIGTVFTETGAGGFWQAAALGAPERWTVPGNWTDANTIAAPTPVAGTFASTRYMIEHLAILERGRDTPEIGGSDYSGPPPTFIAIFRITARGVGGTDRSRVMLQSTYGRIID